MNSEVDISAKIVGELIKASFNSVKKSASKLVKDSWDKVFEDFEPFMKTTYARNANVRILSQKEKDVNLMEVYVQSLFTCGKKVFSDQDLILKIGERENLIINGNGGAG